MIRFPPKKILVAYDRSDVSRTAWLHATALAASCGAAVEIIYVEPWKMSSDLMPPPGMAPAHVRRLREEIRALVGDATKVTILQGDPALRILSFARQHHPDLIVVGTHGRKGLKRAFLGSVAEAVIRGATVPVLAARGRPREIFSILAPVNFTAYSDYGFAYGAAVSSVLSARLTALHVADDPIWSGNPQYRLSNLLQRLPAEVRNKCRPSAKAAVGDAVQEIIKATKGHEWIVLVAHEKALLSDIFFGTTLEQVLRRSAIPVLSVPVPRGVPFALRVSGGRRGARERSLTLA